MTKRRYRQMLPALATMILALGLFAGVAANTGNLPTWKTEATGGMSAGPLGLNSGPSVAADPQMPVAMVIPDASVDASIETRSMVNGIMQDPTGPWIVSWYDFSSYVGGPGNAVFAGHVDYWDVGPSVFHGVSGLTVGAQITVVGQDGNQFVYEVIDSYRVDTYSLSQADFEEITGPKEEAVLTIITCGGAFNGSEYLQRDIVRAELIDTRAPASQAPDNEQTTGTETGDFAEGGSAIINTDGVNIRTEPTTAAAVLTTSVIDTEVTITGEPVEADGYIWYPIEMPDGTTGWIAGDFLTP